MARSCANHWSQLSGVCPMSTFAKIANPMFVRRKMRQHGLGRFMHETAKRTGLPMALAHHFTHAAKIAAHPIEFAERRRGARTLARGGLPYSIPDDTAYKRLPAGSLKGSARVLEICQEIYRRRLPELESMGGRYGINLLASDRETWSRGSIDLRSVPELLDFAMSDEILNVAAEYLGEVPILGEMQLYVTTRMAKNVGNNFYHFDKPYSRQLKFWLAVDDVDAGNGPFTFIPAGPSRTVRQKVRYVGRMTDEEVYAAVPESKKIEFTGSAGNALWVDTCRCAHYGSRTRTRNRVMFELQFMTPFWWAEPTFYFVPALYDAGRYKRREQKLALRVLSDRPPGEGHLGDYE